MLKTLSIPAFAKVNLTLKVTGRRHDGYHLLDSLVAFATLKDHLYLTEAKEDCFKISGHFANNLEAEDNIVLKALNSYRQKTSWDRLFNIVLEKNIPIAAGLGGGSADAAAMLIALNQLNPNPLQNKQLQALALTLGADVPVCLAGHYNDFCRMEGIGEIILPLEFDSSKILGIILLNPNVPLHSPDVFKGYKEVVSCPHQYPATLSERNLGEWLNAGNELTAAAIQSAPVIQTCLDLLANLKNMQGFITTGMSGSGATCFALFDSADAANIALSNMHKIDGWKKSSWVWSGALKRHFQHSLGD